MPHGTLVIMMSKTVTCMPCDSKTSSCISHTKAFLPTITTAGCTTFTLSLCGVSCMQVDVYVMVADAQGLILDCKDYLAPIVTPWEAALALSGRQLQLPHYRLDFRAALVSGLCAALLVTYYYTGKHIHVLLAAT